MVANYTTRPLFDSFMDWIQRQHSWRDGNMSEVVSLGLVRKSELLEIPCKGIWHGNEEFIKVVRLEEEGSRKL